MIYGVFMVLVGENAWKYNFKLRHWYHGGRSCWTVGLIFRRHKFSFLACIGKKLLKELLSAQSAVPLLV